MTTGWENTISWTTKWGWHYRPNLLLFDLQVGIDDNDDDDSVDGGNFDDKNDDFDDIDDDDDRYLFWFLENTIPWTTWVVSSFKLDNSVPSGILMYLLDFDFTRL